MPDTNKIEVNWATKWWELDDVSSRFGRMKYWCRVSDPSKAYIYESTLLNYKQELKDAHDAAQGGKVTYTQAVYDDLYMKKVHTLSAIHPDSGDLIPWFARTSAFVTVNIPIVTAMMLSPPTMFNTVFWQWVN